jgi:hypothetical protein
VSRRTNDAPKTIENYQKKKKKEKKKMSSMSCTEKFKRRKWRNRELRRCCGCLSNPILFFSPIFVCWSYIHTGLHPFFLLRSLLSDSWHLCGSKGEKKNKIKTRQSSKEKKKKSEKNVRL